METRDMRQFGKKISLLGFGCMRLPVIDQESQLIDVEKAEAMVDRAYAAGVNYFDTAFVYHKGKSEGFIGKALGKYPRESFYLADKLPIWSVKVPEDVDSLFAKQQERCQVSSFDFYLAHSLNREYYPRYKAANAHENLLRKKEQGLIKYLGFSFHDNADLLETILSENQWDFVQIQLNYIDWDACDAKRLYELLVEHNLPAVIMEPVRGGALASLNDTAVSILKKADPGASAASWAIRYAASLPNVMTVLSGMTTMEQLEDNLKTMADFRPLSDAERAVLAEAAAAYKASGAIACTGCRYCMDCPEGLDIPRVFALYNHYCVSKSRIHFDNNYKSLRESEQAHNCIACGACVERCPQRLDIPEHVRDIAAFVDTQE